MRFRDWLWSDGFTHVLVWFMVGGIIGHAYLRSEGRDEHVLPVAIFLCVFFVFSTWAKYQQDKKWVEEKAKRDAEREDRKAKTDKLIEDYFQKKGE